MIGRCAGLADLSDVAVLNRLRHAEAWLGHLLDRWFAVRGIGTTLTDPLRVVATDRTTIQEPGCMRNGISRKGAGKGLN